MPSPITFEKNIVLWIDDKPSNHLKLLKQTRKNAEVLTLTSTKMVEAWMKEFQWITKWVDIEVRVISDMVRYEVDRNLPNFYAGVDVLETFAKSG